MTAYRTDKKREFREKLEHLAEEEATLLDQIAQDLDICSKAQEAEARLKAMDIYVTEREDAEEAKKFTDELVQKIKDNSQKRKEERRNLYQKIGKVAKVIAIGATALAAFGVPIYETARHRNSRYEALVALKKYDKPVKITDPKEREEVLYHLDEIFEEHCQDHGTDTAAVEYLAFLEIEGYAINEGAELLNIVGSYVQSGKGDPVRKFGKNTAGYLRLLKNREYTLSEGANILRILGKYVNLKGEENMGSLFEGTIQQFDLFIKAKNIDIQKGECLLQNSKETTTSNIIMVLETVYSSGICE